MLQNAWRLGDRPELGAMSTANTLIRSLDASTPGALPDLRAAPTIFIGSDYGGQHATSKYESYAFLFADLERSEGWFHARHTLRELFLSDGRRFSYKSLRDRRRAAVLPQFLRAIDLIHGLVVDSPCFSMGSFCASRTWLIARSQLGICNSIEDGCVLKPKSIFSSGKFMVC